MKLWILSDLHLEFGDFPAPIPEEADVIVLAGDIHVGAGARAFIERLASAGKPIVYIAGNHEFYGKIIDDVLDYWRNAGVEALHFLENEAVVIDGVRFLGTALWTDVDGCDWFALRRGKQMSDFHCISYRASENRILSFTPRDSALMHEQAVSFLERSFAEPHEGPTVVISHHAPSVASAHDRWRGSALEPYFSAKLENHVLRWQPALWVHGHMHDSADYRIDATRVLCNPRGYEGHDLNPDFDPAMLVEVRT
jgi:Icc-related predicted phosphoesterase